MSEAHQEAAELDEAEEILDVVLPTRYQAAEVLHPGKQPLDFPASAVAAKFTAILTLAPVAPVRRDHFDAVYRGHLSVQGIGIVRFVADQLLRKLVEEASCQNSFHKPALGRRSTFDSCGERKTVTRGDSDDLRPLATLGLAHGEAPFLALANVASTKASSRLSLPLLRKCWANTRSASTNLPSRTHCWKRRWQVW